MVDAKQRVFGRGRQVCPVDPEVESEREVSAERFVGGIEIDGGRLAACVLVYSEEKAPGRAADGIGRRGDGGGVSDGGIIEAESGGEIHRVGSGAVQDFVTVGNGGRGDAAGRG